MTLASSRGAFGATAIAAVQVISSLLGEEDEDAMVLSILREREREIFSASMCVSNDMRLEKWRFISLVLVFPSHLYPHFHSFFPLRERAAVVLCSSSVKERETVLVKETQRGAKREREEERERERREEK